jgi:hypothetical protein
VDGSTYATIHFIDTGHFSFCARDTLIRLHNTEPELDGGDLRPGFADAIFSISSTPGFISLLDPRELLPPLFVATESALACDGTSESIGCLVLDANERRDHVSCDAVCRDSNRDPSNPRFDNVFSNPTDRNGLHAGLQAGLVRTVLAFAYEYLIADRDGFFGPTNPYLTSGAPPTGEQSDCNDGNSTVHPGVPDVCFNGVDDDCDGVVDQNCCGNGVCEAGEDCSACAADCGGLTPITIPRNLCYICDATGEMLCGPGTFLWCCPA